MKNEIAHELLIDSIADLYENGPGLEGRLAASTLLATICAGDKDVFAVVSKQLSKRLDKVDSDIFFSVAGGDGPES